MTKLAAVLVTMLLFMLVALMPSTAYASYRVAGTACHPQTHAGPNLQFNWADTYIVHSAGPSGAAAWGMCPLTYDDNVVSLNQITLVVVDGFNQSAGDLWAWACDWNVSGTNGACSSVVTSSLNGADSLYIDTDGLFGYDYASVSFGSEVDAGIYGVQWVW